MEGEGVLAKNIIYLICLFLKKEETTICNYLVGILCPYLELFI